MTKDQLFNQIVENALDFLTRSIDEFPDHPKHSIISFHTSVELFLKARLMSEHWSLVVTNRQEPDWDSFISGDFRSVSIKEAANKLKKVARSGLMEQELRAFEDVTKHRNKMVHFFHEVDDVEKNNRTVRAIAKIQLNAWYFLHGLLSRRWKEIFDTWSEEIEGIDAKLRKYHEFLDVIFVHITDEIGRRRQAGAIFRLCPSCGFESQEHQQDSGVVYESKCLVCSLLETNLRLECSSCGTAIFFANEGFAECEGCGEKLGPEDVVAELHDSVGAGWARIDGDDSWDLSNCGFCDGWHTVVRIEEDEYVCGLCLEKFNGVAHCGWCNEGNTADMEDSYFSGCNQCDGWIGWHADD